MLTEAGSAHVEELSDPYLLWFWNSNVRSTAIVLNSLVKAATAPGRDVRPIVRWLMTVRRNGRWGNTQENALRDGVAGRVLPPSTNPWCPDFTGRRHAR